MRIAHTAILFLFAAGGCQSTAELPGASDRGKLVVPGQAWLGAALRAPSDAEVEAMALPIEIRLQGRVIESIVAGGPAALAGLNAGDVFLRLDENELYSHDDLVDFLRASNPGEKIDLTVRRAGTTQDETVALELSHSPDNTTLPSSIDWEFASLAQLPLASAKAENEQHRVLVGLSGAET